MFRCENAVMRSLKRVRIAVCGLTNIDITKKSVKTIGISFSYSAVIQNELNLSTAISKMQTVLRSCKVQKLVVEVNIKIFESLPLPKIVYLSLLTIVPRNTVEELMKIRKNFLWNFSTPKIKHTTTRMDFRNGGLKMVTLSIK